MMRRLAFAVLALFVILGASIFSGCTSSSDDSSRVRIGALLPLSGNSAVYGERLREGVELRMYVKQQRGRDSLNVEVVYEDTRMNPEDAVSAFRKLRQEGVQFFIGPYSSSEALAVAPVAKRNDAIILSPGATSPDLSDTGPYFSRIIASDYYDAGVMASFARDSLSAQSAAVVYINNDYGVGVKNAFQDHFPDFGGEVVHTAGFDPGTSDFRTILERLSQKSPDLVLLIGFNEMGFFFRQMGELGLSFQVLSSGLFENPKIVETAGRFANGAYYTMPYFSPDQGRNAIEETFNRAFSEQHPDQSPAIEHGLGYDALNVYLAALRRSDGTLEGVKSAITNLEGFSGAAGSLTFDENGNVVKPYGIKTYRDGEFTWLTKIYEPKQNIQSNGSDSTSTAAP